VGDLLGLFYGFATYGNAGFMREQVCKYMCPYARFQSAMFDKDTLIVTYDAARGEPRGGRSKKADPKAMGLGDCIDCTMCVQVCPTGIDIRDGLQYECIGCAACIDACDEVMDKMGYPRGLIRYSTERALEQGWGKREIWRRVLRPRVLIYSAALATLIVAFAASLRLRTPFKVDIVRDRATLARIVEGGQIENIYRVQVMNATEQPRTFSLAVDGLPGLKLVSEPSVTIDGAQSMWVPVQLRLPYDGPSPDRTRSTSASIRPASAKCAKIRLHRSEVSRCKQAKNPSARRGGSTATCGWWSAARLSWWWPAFSPCTWPSAGPTRSTPMPSVPWWPSPARQPRPR
jgi:cytochrome c oxidase accessory protein FixG